MIDPEFAQVFDEIERSSDGELKDQLYRKAADYAVIRAEWYFLSLAERAERDRARSAAHNTFIDACNILSRAMHRANEGNKWRATLGDDRKRIGDFACYATCRLGILMR